MYSFNSLQLNDYLLWHDLEFNFEPGITLVSGKNASGKSLFVSPIPAILYDADVIPDKARAVFNVSTKEDEYDFTVYNHGKKNRFEVAINGKSQKTETINAARNLIDGHFGANIQYSLFETTVFVSGLVEHPLAKKGSKPSQRLDWIHETLAYASLLDSYQEDVDKQIEIVKNDSVKFKLLKQQLESMEKVEKPDIAVDDLKAELLELVKEIKEQEQVQRDLEEAIRVDRTKVAKPELTEAEARKKLTGFEALVKYLGELKPLHESYEEDLRKYNKLRKTLDEAKAKYVDLCEKTGKKPIDPKKAIEKVSEYIETLSEKIRESVSNNDKYESQKEDRELAKSDHPLQWAYEEDFTSRISGIREELAIAKRQIKFADSGERNCPVCGSKNHGARNHQGDPKDLVKRCTKRLTNLEYDLSVFRARQKKYVKYVDVAELEERLSLFRKLLKAAQNYVDLKKFDVEEPEQVEYDAAKHKRAIRLVEKYKEAVISAKAYKESQSNNVSSDNPYIERSKLVNREHLRKIERRLRGLYHKQTETNDAVVHSQTNVALYRKYREDRAKLIETATPLKQASSDHRLLLVAKKALGRDGFRTRKLENTLELFVNNLNEFAPLLWNEPIKFEIEVGPRKCSVIAHRNNKAGAITTLSGSERRRWQLVSAISMLRLLPYNRRCDTVIFDELEANLDTKHRHQVMQDFIPELLKTVPKVLIISPIDRKELGLSPDRAFMVEKSKNKSRLIEA